jgi:hypothetical protein
VKAFKTCDQHPTCSASDSYLPLCKCWCAECKDIMKDTRLAFKLGGEDRIAELSRAAKAVK